MAVGQGVLPQGGTWHVLRLRPLETRPQPVIVEQVDPGRLSRKTRLARPMRKDLAERGVTLSAAPIPLPMRGQGLVQRERPVPHCHQSGQCHERF